MSSADSDVKTVLNELINAVSEESIHAKRNDSNADAPPTLGDVSDFVEMADNYSVVTNEELLENRVEPLPKHQKKFTKKKTRSVSECETEIESQTKNIRRKFGSEGEILSMCQKIIPPQKQKELNEAIEKYINKLIKDSIFEAVRSVNADSLYEDINSDISIRKNSHSTESEEEFIVEQRLSSDSISELVELQIAGNSENEKNEDRHGSLNSGCNEKFSETESMENEAEEVSFGGYLADLEDTASIDDRKSIGEDSLNNSLCSGLENAVTTCSNSEEGVESLCNVDGKSSLQNTIDNMNTNSTEATSVQSVNNVDEREHTIFSQLETCSSVENESTSPMEENISESKVDQTLDISFPKDLEKKGQQSPPVKGYCEQDQKQSSIENAHDSDTVTKVTSEVKNENNPARHNTSTENIQENVALIAMSEEETLLLKKDLIPEEPKITPLDSDSFPHPKDPEEDRMKVNWKVGNLQIKLPHKSRGKTHLKAWKKRRVVIQPDEFVNDPKNPSVVISVYGCDSKKHETIFWYSVSSLKAVVFRSSSRTHRYAFTISEGGQPIIHLSAENETATQEWMAAIRAVLWPPSPFMELEKMLSGREFEVSIIDNEFSYHCGLLGMYGYLSITSKKLILIHPQQGFVIQEWYLNTVDKFQFVPQPKTQDMHKVLCMSTCSDSSTGKGEIIFFCNESVTLLQSLASSIHQVLSYHSKQEGGKYQKELEEMAEWLVAPPQDCLNVEAAEEHYKVPPRQVKSLLDIPNFIFKKSLSPVASAIYPAPNSEVLEPLDAARNKQTNTSHDSGISTGTSSDDFLNCSVTSFVIGGGPMTGKSSDSELSDAYTPPRTPEVQKKSPCEVVKEEQILAADE